MLIINRLVKKHQHATCLCCQVGLIPITSPEPSSRGRDFPQITNRKVKPQKPFSRFHNFEEMCQKPAKDKALSSPDRDPLRFYLRRK